jgi:hypothetical protein
VSTPAVVLALAVVATVVAALAIVQLLPTLQLQLGGLALVTVCLPLGVVLGAGLVGTFLGDVIAPRLSAWHRDHAVVLASLFVAGVAALLAFAEFGLVLLAAFGLLAGVSTEFGRLAFQSLMQREAPGGAQGRVFVRYEVAFQLAWVAGAFFPAILSIGFRTGTLLLAAFYLALGVAYLVWPRLPRRSTEASPATG